MNNINIKLVLNFTNITYLTVVIYFNVLFVFNKEPLQSITIILNNIFQRVLSNLLKSIFSFDLELINSGAGCRVSDSKKRRLLYLVSVETTLLENRVPSTEVSYSQFQLVSVSHNEN